MLACMPDIETFVMADTSWINTWQPHCGVSIIHVAITVNRKNNEFHTPNCSQYAKSHIRIFITFYITQKLIFVLPKAHHFSLFWAIQIQPISSTPSQFNIILQSKPMFQVVPSILALQLKFQIHFSSHPCMLHATSISAFFYRSLRLNIFLR